MDCRRHSDHDDDEHLTLLLTKQKGKKKEDSRGEDKPVIKKALVELDGAPFRELAKNREKWAVETCYVYPGPIQFFGPAEVADITTKTLALEKGK